MGTGVAAERHAAVRHQQQVRNAARRRHRPVGSPRQRHLRIKFRFDRDNAEGSQAGGNAVTSTRGLTTDGSSTGGETRGESRDVAGLRVADASAKPTITRGNTSATPILIGECAAAFILDS